MSSLSIDSLMTALAGRSTSLGATATASSAASDFSKLLAAQMGQSATDLEGLGTSSATSELSQLLALQVGQSGNGLESLGASSATSDFSKLLALQIGQSGNGLESLGASANTGDDTFAALMSPALGGMEQWETMLTLRLIEVLDRLTSQATASLPGTPQAPAGLPADGPISQGYRPGHAAIDIAVPVGTPVHATAAGKVAFAGWNTEGYGNLVIVENGPYRTYYAHLNQIPVSAGQTVEAGTVIGLSGNTGNSTGPHVHYEVRVNGDLVAPLAAA